MRCGLCGSGISADEKYKKLKNGKINSHVYYGCTKARDKNCPCGYINEDDLIKQLQKLVDGINLNETSIAKKGVPFSFSSEVMLKNKALTLQKD